MTMRSAKTRTDRRAFSWRADLGLRSNGICLGKALAKAHANLYRTDNGLIEALPAGNKVRLIDTTRKFAPLLIDYLDIRVTRNGKTAGDLPPERSLNALLASEHFLGRFRPVDLVTFFPVYLPDFSLAPTGYHDGGPGLRILYLGPQPAAAWFCWGLGLPEQLTFVGTGRSQSMKPIGNDSIIMRMQNKPFTLMSDIEPQTPEWLWPLRVPRGKLTILDGDPGTNKSSLTLDLAARVSTGRRMPDGTRGRRGGVLLLSAEDSVNTVRLRLEAAGANLNRVAVLNDPVTIPDGLELIERSISGVRAKLMVIDPVMAFLGPNANTEQAVRRAMTPLKELAERTNVAVILVRHLTKGGGRRPLLWGSGSIAIAAATRSALLVANDPINPDMRVLAHNKTNDGPLAPSLRFEPVQTDEGVVRLEWRGECAYTSEDLLVMPRKNGDKLAGAEAFLRNLLAEGPVEQRAVKARAAEAAIAYRTVERAKEMLGVRSERKGFGPGSKCFWQLP